MDPSGSGMSSFAASLAAILPADAAARLDAAFAGNSQAARLRDALVRNKEGIAAAGLLVAGAAAGWYLWKAAVGASEAQLREGAAASGGSGGLSLNKYEKQLVGDLVTQADLNVDFDDIGGLDEQIRQIEELVIYPLSHPHLFAHSAVASQPTGVLLYGPPGTGKTLLAKAIAKTANASFLSLNIASIQSKWFGETPKLVEAVFTLARKVSPCVIFADEVDGLLSARNDADAQHVNSMKTKFMEMWDGLTTPAPASGAGGAGAAAAPNEGWVLVIGATNKPWALDPAVLRRMPRQLYVGLPDAPARASILRVLLRRERVAPGGVDVATVAAATEGYSGSDLKELVRAAALVPIREVLAVERAAAKAGGGAGRAGGAGGTGGGAEPRGLETRDLLTATANVKPTGVAAASYRATQAGAANSFAVAAGADRRERVTHPRRRAVDEGAAAAPAPATEAGFASPRGASPFTVPASAAASGSGSGAGAIPDYTPSVSMRLNSQALTSAIEATAIKPTPLAGEPGSGEGKFQPIAPAAAAGGSPPKA